MTNSGRWGVLLALAGCAVLGSALLLVRQGGRRKAEKVQRRRDLQSWEGEGGSLAAVPGQS